MSLNHYFGARFWLPPSWIYINNRLTLLLLHFLLFRGKELWSKNRNCSKFDYNIGKCNSSGRKTLAVWGKSPIIVNKNLKRMAKEEADSVLSNCRAKEARIEEKESELNQREKEIEKFEAETSEVRIKKAICRFLSIYFAQTTVDYKAKRHSVQTQ